MTEEWETLKNLIFSRTMQILVLAVISMITCQIMKFIIFSIRKKQPEWKLLLSTGGFPSSHSSLCVTMCITLGMFQWHDLNGKLDWSFAVAVIISIIVIHDAMGVRLEASKHAKILNNMVENLSEEDKVELGFGKKGKLKEMLGHKGLEVLGGILIGMLVGIAGFFIFV